MHLRINLISDSKLPLRYFIIVIWVIHCLLTVTEKLFVKCLQNKNNKNKRTRKRKRKCKNNNNNWMSFAKIDLAVSSTSISNRYWAGFVTCHLIVDVPVHLPPVCKKNQNKPVSASKLQPRVSLATSQ